MVLDFTESKFDKWKKNFISQPHQIFFVLGLAQAFISMLLFVVMLNGIFAIDIKLFHVLNIAFFMPTSFFLGFLLTVVCRFLAQPYYLQKDYMQIFWLITSSFLIVNIGFFISNIIIIFGLLLSILAIGKSGYVFLKSYFSSKNTDKADELFIVAVFLTAIVGAMLFIWALINTSLTNFAINFTFYVYVVGVVFAVAQKMVPKFHAVYFNIEPKDKKMAMVYLIFLALVGSAFGLSFEYKKLLFVSSLLGFFASSVYFYKSNVLFKKAQSILSILQVGIWWLIIGFVANIGVALFDVLPLVSTHIFGVGFMGTMIIGFGTRVTLGHSGGKIFADKYTTTIFVLFQFVVVLRLFAVYSPSLVMYSGIAWCVVLGLWFKKYLPILLHTDKLK